jgi:hypothetical protein
MEKIISNLHGELLQTKFNILQSEIQKTVNEVAVEMGIDIKNEQWNVSPDFSKFTKVEKL